MKLEEEIKQKKFKSEYQKLVVNILYTNNWLVSAQKDTYQNGNITITQYNILRILRGQKQKPASVNLLKDRMIDKMCDVSRLVERLRVKGFVVRETCSEDRRKSDIVITEAGLKLLKELDKKEKEFVKKLNTLNQSEAKTLNNLLDKLRG